MCSRQNDSRTIINQTEHIFSLQGEVRELQRLLLTQSIKPNHAQVTAEINSRKQCKPSLAWYSVVFIFGFLSGVLSYGL